MSIDLSIKNYTGYYVRPVMKIKGKFGYRVELRYSDGTVKTQQKAGFSTKREANSARVITLAELHKGTYLLFQNLKVDEFETYWLEEVFARSDVSYESIRTYRYIIKNHILPHWGKRSIVSITRADVKRLYDDVSEKSRSVAKLLKTVVNTSMNYAVYIKAISENPAQGVRLPGKKDMGIHTRNIDVTKTLSEDEILRLIEASKDTPIYMQVLFNVLMGLRRSEIIGVKYSDVDFIEHKLKVERQLGIDKDAEKEKLQPKTYTKQEIDLKTRSSHRILPIPDLVFEAILEQKKKYDRNKSRRQHGKYVFQDLGYICCSSYGRPRSRNYHWKHYKKLLRDTGLPDIGWHDLRSSYCTFLLKNDFSPKAVSRLMGHSKEIITADVYGDNRQILVDYDYISKIADYMEAVLPDDKDNTVACMDLLDIVIDVDEYLVLHKKMAVNLCV